MKSFDQLRLGLKEGSWHLPGDKKVAAAFKKAMLKPIKLGKDGDDAVEAIEPYIGDDSLYDDLYAAGKKKPNDDARNIIMKSMKKLNIDPKTFQWKGGKNESIAEVTMGNSTKADAIKKKAMAAKKELDKLIKQLQKLDVDASEIAKLKEETLIEAEDSKAGKYKKGETIVSGQWPNPDKWVSEYVLPNVDKKGVRIYSTGPSFKIEKL